MYILVLSDYFVFVLLTLLHLGVRLSVIIILYFIYFILCVSYAYILVGKLSVLPIQT